MVKDGDARDGHAPSGDPEFGVPAVASKGRLASFLLLCLSDGGSHGHELEEKAEEIGFHNASPQKVHRTLREMEFEGLIQMTGQEEPGFMVSRPGLPWRKCEITESGRAYPESQAGSLLEHRSMSDIFLKAYASRDLGKDLV